MGPTIPVAHDFNCPWCWIGMFQARRLRRDFGAKIEWRSYELYPDELELPGTPPVRPSIPNRPETPKRIELALAAEGLDPIDLAKDSAIRTHRAHEAIEFAKLCGVQDDLLERIYIAYWREEKDIDSIKELVKLSKGLIEDQKELEKAIDERRFADKIIPFNKPAYASGVFNVPTFWIDGERYAEQPYSVLSSAMGSLLPVTFDEGPGPPVRERISRARYDAQGDSAPCTKWPSFIATFRPLGDFPATLLSSSPAPA